MPESVSQSGDQLAILEVVHTINDAWLHKRGETMTNALRPCFAENVVMRGPGFLLLGSGCDFAVQSYHDFVTQATVMKCTLDEPQIDICEQTAAAHYRWEMTYALDGQAYTERGHDLFVLARKGEKWVVVWRVVLPQPG
jgi:hypothetical protein